MTRRRIFACIALILWAGAMGRVDAARDAAPPRSALPVRSPGTAPLLAAAYAGKRIVAVGEHGVVVLSDDGGRSYRQARSVPTREVLTAVSFPDPGNGWAVGHDQVILHSSDGGETWALQHVDIIEDKPLLSVYFTASGEGIAVGMFNNALRTADGGRTWTPFRLDSNSDEDRHLNSIFGHGNDLFVAAEGGVVYCSHDRGESWTEVQTSNKGSFWTGAMLDSGTVVVAGQRGHIFRSVDHGSNWSEVPSGATQSLTRVVQRDDGHVWLVGLSGTVLESGDDAQTFVVRSVSSRQAFTSVLLANPGPIFFGVNGASSPN